MSELERMRLLICEAGRDRVEPHLCRACPGFPELCEGYRVGLDALDRMGSLVRDSHITLERVRELCSVQGGA